jgi:hypothetical protein
MTNLITHIDKCLLKWIWFNTNRRYTWHCLLLFGVTNNRVYNDAFHTFTFSMPQSVSFTWPKKIRIILLILDLKLGTIDNRKDYSDVQTWGEFFFFIIIIYLFLDKNRNTGFSSRHLLRLQKFCMNSRFRTGNFWIQWYRFDFAFILVI